MFNVQRPEVLDRISSWVTRRADRTVLAVVHNVTAATRLFDVLPILADDPRVQVHFTCPESSPFHGQIAEYLSAREVTPVSWQQAVERQFDLAIAASHGGPLNELKAPLIVLPHGMGYNKYLPRNPKSEIRNPKTGSGKTVFGMSPDWLLHEGRVIASSLVLSHPEQLDRLCRSCPEAAEVAVVAGDPSFDRMLASLPLRHLYREALGVDAARRLILVSSTWGPASLYGSQPDLILRLRTELPLDDYAVALALHPNTWSAHSPWQIRRWLHACTRAGVTLLPAHEGWRAGLVGADLIVGDHGSVTFYGASLGRPVTLAEAPHDAVDPDSAIGRILTAATRLDLTRRLLPQIETTLARGQTNEVKDLAELATSMPLKSHAALRAEFYRLLALPEPETTAEAAALPVPVVTAKVAATQSVHVTLNLEAGGLRATATRFAAEQILRGRPLGDDAHLVVSTDEPSETALQLADVIVHHEPGGPPDWITRTLAALPGATVATRPADDGAWFAGTRDGRRVRFEQTGEFGPVLASVVLTWVAQGHSLSALPERIDLIAGARRQQARATLTR
ncbi:hypothetical protein FXN61_32180 [Lentzea sp. PSKA42]|uniref:CDP-Glycerol:Poly(Glycerophosphate) glycerophosphotransferase n=1 Tax=Lentzea indica TaxID=2604800 RepID=A0ABX1FR01_9PSEU|nr:hypothetical protein [Lentzea indica]NKE61182.1 hypothetical protein [Lentzea indica]